jgi:hypothetical protein
MARLDDETPDPGNRGIIPMSTRMKAAALAAAITGALALGAMPVSVAYAQGAPAKSEKAMKGGKSDTRKEAACAQFKKDSKEFQDCMKAAGTQGKAAKKPTASGAMKGEKPGQAKK